MKAVVDAETEEILGAAILAPEGGELMSMVELAMMGKLRYSLPFEECSFCTPRPMQNRL